MSSEAYGALAFAYDDSTGRDSARRIMELLEPLLRRVPHSTFTHLDLACAGGLALRHFRKIGYRSVGLDASMAMARVAARRAPIVSGDMRALPFKTTFGIITLLNDALSSLRRKADVIRCFRSVRRCMNGQSLLVFDTTRPRAMSLWSRRGSVLSRGPNHRITIGLSYSRFRQTGTLSFDGWARYRGIRHEVNEVHHQRAYSRAEIMESLGAASLRAIETIGFRRFPGERDEPEDSWLFIARKV